MRLKLSFFAVVSTIISICAAEEVVDYPVITSVFYETYCPDSVKFITQQLYPTYQTLNESFFKPLMIPFGRANDTTFPNGTISFSCQHGEKECYGNKVHACVLNLKVVLGAKLKFINCSMARTDLKNADPYKYPIDECAIESGLSAQDIRTCLGNVALVDQLLQSYGNETKQHNIPGFPYIVFNSTFDNATSQKSEKDLRAVLCEKKYIPENATAYGEFCKSPNSSATTLAFTAFPVILLTFVFSKLY